MYLLGLDIGSSSIKAALVETATRKTIAVVQSPTTEMEMHAAQVGWAEQDPAMWWKNVCLATQQLLTENNIQSTDIQGIGIAYQMHGLVVIDKNQQVLRPSIIWCDSRAVEIGEAAFNHIGHEKSLAHHLNSPGNFTAAKLKWVKENEPEIYAQIDKIMLPGDYIAMKLTGEVMTTVSGLSEGIFWDFKNQQVSDLILEEFDFDKKVIPAIVPTCSQQGKVTTTAAVETGLSAGISVAYRAGDQPNNALCLNVLEAGEVAATGGTSGVVYGVVDKPVFDAQSRVNGFAHVNYSTDNQRVGILLCINGAGSQYAWIKKNIAESGLSYSEMEQQIAQIPIGADGLQMLPFGNGAERMLCNKNIGSQIINLQFNRHSRAHIFRAALEGIAFAFVYGMEILGDMGMDVSVMRVGNDNLFQSPVFANTIATLMNTRIDVIETTGAVGAAKAAGVATGGYMDLAEAMEGLTILKSYVPQANKVEYQTAYNSWHQNLVSQL
ncbi:MAG: xylulokinase [Saprospiraceae bacterium]